MKCFWIIALLLGSSAQGAWGPEERLTTNSTQAETGLNHGAITVDSQGIITVAWAEQDGINGNYQIYTQGKSPGETWDPAQLAVAFSSSYPGTGLGAKFPALATLPGDSLLLVWHDYRIDGILNAELFTKVRGTGQAWGDSTQEVRLTTSQHPETGGDNSYVPNLTVTPEGTAHVAWYDYRYDGNNAEILFKSRNNGVWDTTPGDAPDTNLSANPSESHFPALAAGSDGSLHLAWRDNGSGTFRILYRVRNPSGVWSTPDILSPPGVAAAGVDLTVAADHTVVAVWSDARHGTQSIFLRERSPAGVWGTTHQVSPTGSGAEEPAVQVDWNLLSHVVWQDARVSPFNRELFYQSQPLGASWDSTGESDTQLTDAPGSSARPTLTLGASNQLCLLWQDARHGSTEMYYREQDIQTGVSPGSPSLILVPSTNPFRRSVTWNSRDVDLSQATAWIVNLQGRRVQHLYPQGNRVRWDGMTVQGAPAVPGVYFLRIREGNRPVAHSKVVKLP